MSDYIKREDAIKALEGWKISPIVLDPVPSADVVEVVRCKDCKHYGKFGMKCNKLHLKPIESWRYCSFGERADT